MLSKNGKYNKLTIWEEPMIDRPSGFSGGRDTKMLWVSLWVLTEGIGKNFCYKHGIRRGTDVEHLGFGYQLVVQTEAVANGEKWERKNWKGKWRVSLQRMLSEIRSSYLIWLASFPGKKGTVSVYVLGTVPMAGYRVSGNRERVGWDGNLEPVQGWWVVRSELKVSL